MPKREQGQGHSMRKRTYRWIDECGAHSQDNPQREEVGESVAHPNNLEGKRGREGRSEWHVD